MANDSNTWKYIIQSHGKYGECQQYLEVYYIVPWEIWRMIAIPGSILYSPMGNMANVSNTWKYIIQSHGKYGEYQQYLEVYYIVPWEIWRMIAIPGSILYSPMGNMANDSNTWKYIIQSYGKYGECQQYLEVYYIVPWEIWRILAIPGSILYSPMGNMANDSNTWKYIIQSHGKYGECQQYLEVYYIVPWEIWRILAIPGSILYSPMGNMANDSNTWKYIIQSDGKYGECQQYLEVYYIVRWEIWRMLAIPGSILYSPMGNMANVSNTWKYIYSPMGNMANISNTWKYIIQSHGKYGECQQYLEVYYIVPWEIWRMLAIPGSILYSPMGNMADVSNTWKYIIQYHGKYGECQQYLEVYYIVPWEIWRMLAIPGSILYSPMGNMANVSNTWKYIIQSHGKYGECQQYLEVYYIVPWEIWRMLAIPGSILYSPMGNMANVSNTWKYIYSPMGNMANISNTWKYIIQSHGKYGECQQYLEVNYIVPWEIWRMLAIPGSILYSPMGNMANVSNTWKYIIQSHGKYGECQQYLEVYYIVPWEIWRMLAIPGSILYSPMGNMANVSNTWKYIIQSHGKYGECQQYLEIYYIVPWEIWRMLAIPGSILYSPMGNMANVSNTWKYIIQSHGKYGECQQYLEVYYIVPWEIWRMLAIHGSILYSPMGNTANVSNTWKYIDIVPWEIQRILAIPGSILYSPM